MYNLTPSPAPSTSFSIPLLVCVQFVLISLHFSHFFCCCRNVKGLTDLSIPFHFFSSSNSLSNFVFIVVDGWCCLFILFVYFGLFIWFVNSALIASQPLITSFFKFENSQNPQNSMSKIAWLLWAKEFMEINFETRSKRRTFHSPISIFSFFDGPKRTIKIRARQ